MWIDFALIHLLYLGEEGLRVVEQVGGGEDGRPRHAHDVVDVDDLHQQQQHIARV